MTTENVIEGAVKCIRILNPDFKMSHLFPPGKIWELVSSTLIVKFVF